ncbi:hypothetical protein CEXT_334731 [Caerostris extrusa]|uniref:Uncharacterized protein n=1 Tax=Caerostris extrusa TaxID=172846 RepID=A0AAV4PRF2_CAEEX|nr:hypothetical protein CEXT_334731 [Caerostris extrusa]
MFSLYSCRRPVRGEGKRQHFHRDLCGHQPPGGRAAGVHPQPDPGQGQDPLEGPSLLRARTTLCRKRGASSRNSSRKPASSRSHLTICNASEMTSAFTNFSLLFRRQQGIETFQKRRSYSYD